MADVAITAANVVPVSGAAIQSGTAGVAITAGQLVYNDSSTSTIKLCHAVTSLATASCVGVAIDNAAANQPVSYQNGGDITIGGTLTQGEPYFTSGTNAGGLAPKADLATNWMTVCFGIAKSATVLTIINRGASTLTAHA
jgi:hypothetical protein